LCCRTGIVFRHVEWNKCPHEVATSGAIELAQLKPALGFRDVLHITQRKGIMNFTLLITEDKYFV